MRSISTATECSCSALRSDQSLQETKMKKSKIGALTLSLIMTVSVACGCGRNDTDPTDVPAPSKVEASLPASEPETDDATDPTETTEQVTAEDFNELTVATDVTDEDDTVVIYGWNDDEFTYLLDTYAPDVNYDMVLSESTAYTAKLDAVLASGDKNVAPDLFICEAAYAKKYLASDYTLPVNDLGIAYDEFVDSMFSYTTTWATDSDNVIKGVTWEACPGGVWYNRDLTEQYLGTQDPAEVGQSFETWDAFMQTAADVNAASGGTVKVIADPEEIFIPYLGSRTEKWVTDGALTFEPVMEDYFDISKSLYTDGLTFTTGQWTDGWYAGAEDGTVMTYWGPVETAYLLGLNDEDNPTYGSWALTSGPSDYYWGGTWIMASKYCDTKASCATIMRNIAIDKTNLTDMVATGGMFVNNVDVMTSAANNSEYSYEFLGGQNPYSVLLDTALKIDNSEIGEDDALINSAFEAAVKAYSEGKVSSIDDAKADFEATLKDFGIV